jgi:hypothetical protein
MTNPVHTLPAYFPNVLFNTQECVELYLHSSNTLSWRDAQLKEKRHRDIFNLILFISVVKEGRIY